ncbi:hypothetical protein [Sporosarcina sp. FSL K6-3508]|uniref:hypothetical protein n=1 Tax=Sporosarcina sp. FSL K6-3508 TaxID=2921557 RepID=UPI00315AFEC7
MSFMEKVDNSYGLQLMITGLARLVEEEGYTPHEAIGMLHEVGRNTFHALTEIKRGESNVD